MSKRELYDSIINFRTNVTDAGIDDIIENHNTVKWDQEEHKS